MMTGRWNRKNGYRDVLRVGWPLIVSMGATSVMHFTDRMFLSHYSQASIAAALPASIASFLFMSFFMGVAGYVNVFIAQYTGAGRPERVGAALWQGIWFGALSWAALAALSLIAEPLFVLAGHASEVQALEVRYYTVLNLGAGLGVMGIALSCFYSGRGLTRPVMLVNLAGAALNIPLDYALINGAWGFPEWGITGAGVATVCGWVLVLALYAAMIFRPASTRRFALWRAWRPDRALFARLMRYGLPGGAEFFIDIFGFTFFVFVVGRLGETALAATNIAIAINTLAFLPIVGVHVALSTLMGQAIGAGRPEDGAQATISSVHLTLLYMGSVALCYLLFPQALLQLFAPEAGAAAFEPVRASGTVLLRIIAVMCLFDGMIIVLFGALKGAGDTMWCMKTMTLCILTLLVLPVWLTVEVFGGGLVDSWLWIIAYMATLATLAIRRYRRGAWRTMSVIEHG